MSFQVNSTDLKPDTEIKESVSTAEEEFKSSTEETERKLIPEDEEERKLVPEDEEERKLVPEDEDGDKSSDAGSSQGSLGEFTPFYWRRDSSPIRRKTSCRRKVKSASSEEEFKSSTEETERKLIPEDEEERNLIPEDKEEFKKNRTKKLKRKLVPEDEDGDKSWYYALKGSLAEFTPLSLRDIITLHPRLENKDDDEEKEISRTQSMENLALMNKNPLQQ